MERTEWIEALAAKVRPGSPKAAANRLTNLLPELIALPAWVFCERSVSFVAARCSQTPNLAHLFKLLAEFRAQYQAEMMPASIAPPIPPPPSSAADAWDTRQDELRREWDDPAGIRARIRTCDGEVRYLRFLASLVAKWAPQHLGLLPPETVEAYQRDADYPKAASARITRPSEHPLTPEQLAEARRQANITPPNGAKRHAPATAASAAQPRTAPVGSDASARDTDADAIPF